MKVLIIGAAGMVGKKLCRRICADQRIGSESIELLLLHDVVPPEIPPGSEVRCQTEVGDLGELTTVTRLLQHRPDVIFHLAAVVSGEAEADFEKGYGVNLDSTRLLFETIRGAGESYCPRIVFTSSIAVFGKPFPEVIEDDFLCAPLTSYGTQKAICELLLSDYSRRGILDGVGIRLPTICVRPGKPNKAASGFFSNIIREPLNHEEAVLPVSDDVRHWFASPRSAVGFLLKSATIDSALLGDRRTLGMPGLSATVGEQIEALRRVAGEPAVARIRREPDETIARIVDGWPQNFNTARARSLGFQAESTFDEIIRIHIEDELTS